MTSSSFSHCIRLLLIGATFGIYIYTAYTWYVYTQAFYQERTKIDFANNKSMQKSIIAIEDHMKKFMDLGKQIADYAGNTLQNKSAYDALCDEIKKKMMENPDITGISIVYAPYQYDPQKKLHSVFYHRVKSELKEVALETLYDYTTTTWYQASKTNIPQWVSPYYGPAAAKILTSYVVPIFHYNYQTHTKEFCGACVIDISLEYLHMLIASISLYKDSYAMLTTRDGLILAHPTTSYAQNGMTIFDFARNPGNKDFIKLGNAISRTAQGELNFSLTSAIHKEYRAIFREISSVNWVLSIIGPRYIEWIPTMGIRRLLIHSILALIMCVLCSLALIFRVYTGNIHGLWMLSSGSALSIAIGVCCVWLFHVTSIENYLLHDNIVDYNIALDRFLYLQQKTNPGLYRKDVKYIPTGLYIYALTLEVINPNMIINGHVWQKYSLTKDKDVAREVVIFNAIEQSFEKVYDETDGENQTIGWRFSAKIKGNFDYTRYPFDQQNPILILGNKDYAKNVILTPDFEAFTSMRTKHPEIDPIINMSPWKIGKTYSFYELTRFGTDFGIKNYSHQTDFPTLCFNISVSRDFVYPFTATIIPIIIIVIVAFTILLIIGLSKQNNDLAALILSLASGLLFATILSHQTFQRSVEASRLTYFEYFYFILYVIIILITINGVAYALHRGGMFINYERNTCVRLLFWPLVLLIFLITTLIFFY